MHKLNYIVYIGRFQPFHKGHLLTLETALQKADQVIVCVGSANSPRTVKDPFSYNERVLMIRASLSEADQKRVHVVPIEDYKYNENQWVSSVQKNVYGIAGYNTKIGIIGYNKDESTYYLNYFKNWEYVESTLFDTGSQNALNATKIRELLFTGYQTMISSVLPKGTIDFIDSFKNTEDCENLIKEYQFMVAYEKQYEGYPYSVNFLTVDSVVVQSGHVLLVQRSDAPGKGLWAFPGGHVGPNEDLLTAAIRELKEETNLKVPEKVLKGSLFHVQNFDHPDRSLRGRVLSKNARTLTVAHGFKLNDGEDLPKVKASSDASKAWWVTIGQFMNMRDRMFEDHFDIGYHMLQRL